MLKFFIIFSRTEFTLKESGCARKSRYDIAEADWDRFANAIEPNFDPTSSPELIAAIDYLTNNPPGLQKIDPSNNLFWSANVRRPRQTNLQWRLSLVKTVRNNLFHGGKCPFDSARDVPLIEHSLVVLEACIKVDTKILATFSKQ
jgi:hypothetical protein